MSYIKVRAMPDAKKEKVTKKSDSFYEIHVKERAELGLANGRIKEILEEIILKEDKRMAVRLIKGSRSRSKIYEVFKKKQF